jgi:serine/threonine-protein kinase
MSADGNLLFGVLALQADFLDAAQFAEACSAWASRKDTPLADLLVERGWLTAEQRAAVDLLLATKLRKHGGDSHVSLAAVATHDVRSILDSVADADVRQSLADLPTPTRVSLPATVAYEPGSRQRYTLTRLHAQGGIGQVWLAHDEDLGRDVALKELRPDRGDSPATVRRFLEEAKITGQLEHPGVVPVYELVQPKDGRPCYAMRFVGSRTLADAIKEYHRKRQAGGAGPLDLRELLTAFVGVCNAVAYAHSRGVLHRDLKPHNVALGEFGEVLVLDWGLAKVVGKPEDPASLLPVVLGPANGSDRTQQGHVLGTPSYMAPEQARGRPDLVDRRSDVYGLGAILYEVLTGAPPFTGADAQEVLKNVVQGPPVPPRQRVPMTAPALQAVCLQALAREPGARYPSARDLGRDVEQWLADEPVSAFREPLSTRVGRWVRRHRTKVTVAVAAVGVAAACLGVATVLLAAANRRERNARSEVERQKERADQNLARARKAVEDYCTNVAGDPRLKQADLHALREKLLQTAVPFYEEVIEQKAEDQQLEADRGMAYFRLALLRAEMGKTREAVAGFEAAQGILARLSQDHPKNLDHHHGLARSYENLGLLLSDLGRRSEAEDAHRKALALFEPLARDFPAVPDYRQELATTHNNLGLLLSDLGRRSEAEDAYKKALALQEPLARDFPAVPDYRRDLAGSHTNLGTLLRGLGRRSEAGDAYRKALALYEPLARDFPAVPDYRRELASSHNNMGALLRDLGRRSEAGDAYRKALALYEPLARDFPAVPDYRRDLAGSHTNLGTLLRDLGRRSEAEDALRKALALREQLARDFPDVPAYRVDVGGTYVSLGNLRRDSGQAGPALDWYAKGIQPLQAALAADPNQATARLFLRNAHYGRAQALTGLARHAEAAEDWARAMELDNGPDRPFFRRKRALSLARAGDHAQAVSEANALAEAKGVHALTLYDLACVCSLASASVKNDDRYAARAVELLRQAVAKGYKDIDHLKKDPDLDPLRGRDDFKKLLAELEAGAREQKS